MDENVQNKIYDLRNFLFILNNSNLFNFVSYFWRIIWRMVSHSVTARGCRVSRAGFRVIACFNFSQSFHNNKMFFVELLYPCMVNSVLVVFFCLYWGGLLARLLRGKKRHEKK